MSFLLITNASFERFPAELLSVAATVFVYNSHPEHEKSNLFVFDNVEHQLIWKFCGFTIIGINFSQFCTQKVLRNSQNAMRSVYPTMQ